MIQIINFKQSDALFMYELDKSVEHDERLILVDRESDNELVLPIVMEGNKIWAEFHYDKIFGFVANQHDVQHIWDIMLETKNGRKAIKLRPGLAKEFNPVGLEAIVSRDETNLWIQQYTTKGRTVGVSTTHSMSRRSDIDLPVKIPATAVERANYELMLNPAMPARLNSKNAAVVAVNPNFFNEEKNSSALRREYIDNPEVIFYVSETFRDYFEQNSFFSMNLDRTKFYPETLNEKNVALIEALYEFTGKNKKVRPSSVDGQVLFKAAFIQSFVLSESGDNVEITIGYDSYDENPQKMALVFSDRDQVDAEGQPHEFMFNKFVRLTEDTVRFDVPVSSFKQYIFSDYWLESSVIDVNLRFSRNESATISKALNVFTPEQLASIKELGEIGVPGYAINQRIKEMMPHNQFMIDYESDKLVVTPYAGAEKRFVLQTARISPESAASLLAHDVRFPALASKANRIAKYYAKQRADLPIEESTVLYETRDGQSIVDSPLAIFFELNNRAEMAAFSHKWVVQDLTESRVQRVLEKFPNVEFVERNTKRYYDLLASAKYVITNSTFQNFFSKREEQIYVNTWHGIPLKKMGFDLGKDPRSAQNVLRNFLMTDYFLQPNEYASNIFQDAYKLSNIYQGQIVEGAYPRNDLSLMFSRKEVVELLGFDEVQFDTNKKVILYSPTWKGTSVSNPTDSVETMLSEMQMLKSEMGSEYNVLIKVHPFVYKSVEKDPRFQGILVPDEVDPNIVMGIVAVLITDYSSIFFDFALTQKPILFYVPDFKSYKNNRGTYLNVNELPGPVSENINDLIRLLRNLSKVEKRFAGKREKFIDKYGSVFDGSASKKIVDYIFNGKDDDALKIKKLSTDKKSILIYPGSLAGNGITSSYLNLINKIDLEKFDVTQVATLDKQFGLANTKKVPNAVRQMFRIGSGSLTLDQVVQDEVYKARGFVETGIYYPAVAYENDFARLFPQTKFDIVIDFSGYSYSWGSLLLGGRATQSIAWQHNDILADSQRMVGDTFIHRVNVEPLISIYSKFDKLVSVSPVLRDLNYKNLSQYYGNAIPESARNTINVDKILERSLKQRLFPKMPKRDMFGELLPKFNKRATNFVTMGRLSPEKNQLFLIDAFKAYTEKYDSNARLYLLGQGPLAEALKEKIESNNLSQQVFMLGHNTTPHLLMRQMDVFVLPSLYEGQPMVLLEALTLNMKVMASDIPQNAYVLGFGDLGLLKDGTSVNEFVNGLDTINRANKNDFNKFDPYKYNDDAVLDFYEVLK